MSEMTQARRMFFKFSDENMGSDFVPFFKKVTCISGKKKVYKSCPYHCIKVFSVETAGRAVVTTGATGAIAPVNLRQRVLSTRPETSQISPKYPF